MPKKTRREKIIAQLKRQLYKQNELPIKIDNPADPVIKNTPLISSLQPIINQRILNNNNNNRNVSYTDYTYVYSDLKRIILVTFAALCFEGFLYFILNVKK